MRETIDSIEELFKRFDRRLSAFITPMGPFIDPGSDGFEQAENRGYVVRAHTLAEHRALLEAHDWESMLNYETRWMTRREIVQATYEAGARLNNLKERYGRLSARNASRVQRMLKSEGTITDKRELFPPGAFLKNFRIGGILRLLVREIWTHMVWRREPSPAAEPARAPAPTLHTPAAPAPTLNRVA